MEKVKCECGHVNPFGTYLCESCGKPLKEDENQVVDMRYEGVARRSQTYNKTIIDKIWSFFSSVKVGIAIIVILLIASAIGTIFPQEMYIPPGEIAATYYENEYGTLGKIYYTLGLHNLYSSWWYMLLIAALGVSLVICSLDRFVPLYRALKTQRVKRHERFLKAQRLFGKSEKLADGEQQIIQAEKILSEKKYKIRKEGNNILAEKGRFSRWGPYVNHIGLIIFLIGCMLRYFPAMYFYDHIWIREGEEAVVKGTDGEYFIRNEKFTIEMYDEDDELYTEALERTNNSIVKSFETSATLLRKTNEGAVGAGTELEEVKHEKIRVNEPLKFDGFSLYQVDYKLNEFSEITFQLAFSDDSDNKENISTKTFTVDLYDPEKTYDLGNGYRVEIVEYFPNFFINDNREPETLNRVPDNPRIIFELFTPDMNPEEDNGEISIVGLQVNEAIYKVPLDEDSRKEIQRHDGMNDILTMNVNNDEEEQYIILGLYVNDEITENNEYTFEIVDFETNNVTALTISRDRTIPILILGGFIFIVGLVQGSYWHHRRIWIQLRDDVIWVAAHTNKNWHALKKEIAALTEKTSIPFPKDQLEDNDETPDDEKVKE